MIKSKITKSFGNLTKGQIVNLTKQRLKELQDLGAAIPYREPKNYRLIPTNKRPSRGTNAHKMQFVLRILNRYTKRGIESTELQEVTFTFWPNMNHSDVCSYLHLNGYAKVVP